jgi:hypothetical protein
MNAALLVKNRDRYIGTKCIYEKRTIVDEIVDYVDSKRGRFLKLVNRNDGSCNNKQWNVISIDSARLKTAHAIQYRLRKKAKQSQTSRLRDMWTKSAKVLESQCSEDTLSCTLGGIKQITSGCTDKCSRCERLEANLRWILSTQGQPISSGDDQSIGCTAHCETTMESKGDRVGYVTPEAPRAVKVWSDPLASLEPLELSVGPPFGLNDSRATALADNAIDPDWLLSSLS